MIVETERIPTPLRTSSGMQQRFPVEWTCWGIFLLLQGFCIYMITHHAMWRDELQTWSMVRESQTLGELFFNMRFDGTPPLWYLALWLLSTISFAPLVMQLFHFACAFLAGFLVMKLAPFPIWIRLMFVSGYYFAFEYMVISRGYVLGLLFSIIYCAAAEQFRNRPYLAGVIIGLIANTTAYGAILSIALIVLHAFDFVNERRMDEPGAGFRFLQMLLVYLPLFAIAVYFMVPAKGGNFVQAWNLSPTIQDLSATLARILVCLVPVPEPGIHFWNSLVFSDHGLSLAVPAAAVTAAVATASLWGSKRALFLFSVCLLGMTIFGLVIYLGYNRHGGTLMVCFVIASWLAESSRAKRSDRSGRVSQWRRAALIIILVANLAAFAVAAYGHTRYPFSGSKEMANYIIENHLEKRPIIGDIDFEVSAVAGYLNIPIYYVANKKRETFIRWNEERIEQPLQDAVRFIAEIEAGSELKPLLLLSYPGNLRGYRLLYKTAPSIVEFEMLYLYEKI